MNRLDLITFGEMVIDFLPGDESGVYIRKAGGAPANAAIAAARCGLRVGFCGRVGDDDFGRFLMETLSENNVFALCGVPVKEAVTTMAFVTLHEDGERSFTFARKPGADMFLSKADVDAAGLETAAIIHAGSCSLSKPPASEATAYALKRGKELGKLVSFDLNYRDLLWDGDSEAAIRAVREILPFVDLLKISEEEAEMLGGEEEIAVLARDNGISAVIETLGGRGACCYWNGNRLYADGLRATCVDATGAGDAFWGAFLSYLIACGLENCAGLNGDILTRAMRRGNLAGSLCVRKKGAIESLPTAKEIDALEKENEK